MDDCKHVRQVKFAVDKSFLNPRNWSCCECGTTESVWVSEPVSCSLSTCTCIITPAVGDMLHALHKIFHVNIT